MSTLNDTAPPEHTTRTLRLDVARSLDRALSGEPLSVDDAAALLDLGGEETGALLATAGHVRDRSKGRTVTYSPKVFLPITNLCRDRCSYCTFRKDPRDAGAWTMLPEEIRSWSRRAGALGCIEALLCLGDKPEHVFRPYRRTLEVLGHDTTIEYVGRACAIALEEGLLPHTNAGLMTRDEMALLKPMNVSMGLMLETTSRRLLERGEAHHRAPDKDPALRLRMIEEAGELQIAFTTGILVGIGETTAERADSLVALRDLYQRYGHIQEIIIQNFRAKPITQMAARGEPDALALARTVAVARLMMPDMNIQAPPNLSPYDHRLLLGAGINDWGGISPLTDDYVNPEARWPQRRVLAETCSALGFALRPRLPVYPEFLSAPGFVETPLRARATAVAQQRGVAS